MSNIHQKASTSHCAQRKPIPIFPPRLSLHILRQPQMKVPMKPKRWIFDESLVSEECNAFYGQTSKKHKRKSYTGDQYWMKQNIYCFYCVYLCKCLNSLIKNCCVTSSVFVLCIEMFLTITAAKETDVLFCKRSSLQCTRWLMAHSYSRPFKELVFM